jgi:pantothenate kinase
MTLDDLVRRATTLAAGPRRAILGITGSPGAGKSTLVAALLARLGDHDVAHVPMDGFHLADVALEALGRRDTKGAPDTFDVGGYVALLRRLHTPADGVVYAPLFDRALEAAVAGAVPVRPDTPIVVTEGNFLLLDGLGWQAVRSCLDEVWYLDVPADVRTDRLVARRRSFGDSRDAAQSWVRDVDAVNGGVVEATRSRADLVARLVPHPRSEPTHPSKER